MLRLFQPTKIRQNEMQFKSTEKATPNSPAGDKKWVVTRRDFLKLSGVALSGLAFNPFASFGSGKTSPSLIRFGMVTDSHYADSDPKGTRYYRQSLKKMKECVELMNDQKVDFLVELGDFKDMSFPVSKEKTLGYLRAIESVFQKFRGPTYHVLGNHDTDSISKNEFLAAVENTGTAKSSKYYSFSSKGIYFIVLDADYRSDGSDYDSGNFDWKDTNVPAFEQAWLRQELKSATLPIIVFIHQPLDGSGNLYVKNAASIRSLLRKHKKVLAVFQGHKHAGDYNRIDGIYYYTLKALVEGSGSENNSYAIVDVKRNGDIIVTGYRRAVSKKLLL